MVDGIAMLFIDIIVFLFVIFIEYCEVFIVSDQWWWWYLFIQSEEIVLMMAATGIMASAFMQLSDTMSETLCAAMKPDTNEVHDH
jgi:hypothetical protein